MSDQRKELLLAATLLLLLCTHAAAQVMPERFYLARCGIARFHTGGYRRRCVLESLATAREKD